jgi:diaminohydroxyphosphoribosylaminopyrimidine deaminase / 5-amino-6-(5-phosphoribosylamino)uracil reductase
VSSDRAEDRRFLGQALALALGGRGRTHPNPMVGSLVVRDGAVLGSGFHLQAGREHAEVLAIAQAGEKARGATLYSSLEPCCHQGRTPPCVERIVSSGIRRVVACTEDPDPRVNGRGLGSLRAAGLEVDVGLLAEEGRRLNEAFFHFVATGRPLVRLKAGSSMDGRIAARPGAAGWITSEEARAEAMLLRERHDAVLVGVRTVLADDPLLTLRPPARVRPIVRVVLDSGLRTPPRGKLLSDPDGGPVLVFHVRGAPAERMSELRAAGATPIEAGKGPRVELPIVLGELARRDLLAVLVEGGGEVLGAFARARLADRVSLFVAPSLLGPGGVALTSSSGAEDPESPWEALPLRWLGVRRVGPDLLMEAESVDPRAMDPARAPR